MPAMRVSKCLSLLLVVFVFVVAANAADELPKGTKITVRIKSTINSNSVATGDRFEATLDRDLVVNGKTIAAQGATARGQIDSSGPSTGVSNGSQTAGYLIIRLTEIETNDAIYNFTTSTYTRQGHGRANPQGRAGSIGDTIAGIGRPSDPGDIYTGTSIGRGSGSAALIPAETVVTFKTTTAAKIESK
jgi:hypothetical protein